LSRRENLASHQQKPSAGNHRQRAVIVAMIAVRMVQVSVDQIISVITVWNRLMTTAGAMSMRRLMVAASVLRRAAIRIRGSDFDHVFIDMTVVHMMQVAVVEIIDVAVMSNRGMTAARPVHVWILGVIRRI
jgi:hypothetical protein